MWGLAQKKGSFQAILNIVMDEPKTFHINRLFYKCQHGCWKLNWHRKEDTIYGSFIRLLYKSEYKSITRKNV